MPPYRFNGKKLRLMQNYENFIPRSCERTNEKISNKGKKKLEKFFSLCRWRKKKFSSRAQPCLIVKSIIACLALQRCLFFLTSATSTLFYALFCCFNFRSFFRSTGENAKERRKLLYEFILHSSPRQNTVK